jgi:palmitoyl-protein thioesterase|eukprot:Stramenopile-MAST_4_protein_2070
MRGVLFLLLVVATRAVSLPSWRPVVLMHGMNGDSSELNKNVDALKKAYPGIYVHNLNILQKSKSLFASMESQMKLIVETIRADPKLKDGFNFYGESQGALEARIYVTKTNNPPVHNLVALCGPQAGVGECPTVEWPGVRQICADVGSTLDIYAWPFCSFCGFWKDNRNEDEYEKHSKWLAEANNEQGQHGEINETYIKNMESLNKYMVTRAMQDEIVQPSWSAFHQYWKWGDASRSDIVDLTETEGYKNNWLGLKTLNERGDFIRNEFNGSHTRYNMTWWLEHILPMFNNTL